MRINSSARSRRAAAATPFILSGNSMFWPTERCGNSASDWKTRQVGRRFAGRSLIRCAAQEDVAVAGRLHAGQHAQERGLARARRADHGEELALAHLEVDAVDRRQLAERSAHADELQDRPRRGNRGQGGQPRARFAAVIRSSALS